MSLYGVLTVRRLRRSAAPIVLAATGLGSLAGLGHASTLHAVVLCPECPPQTCKESGRLKVFFAPVVTLTSRNQFVVYACSGRAEQSIVVLRRAAKDAVLSSRPVRLSAKYNKAIVLTAPSQRGARYRVTVGLGEVHVDVTISVRPSKEPVRID